LWRTVAVKSSNDVTRLQALVDKKRVVVTEAAIRDALHLDDAEGVDCLSNEKIFTELARMGYEKLTTKLTFYKAFFSSQWKFLIHTILQSMSATQTETAVPEDAANDQSIPSPTPLTPPPPQPQDVPSTSHAQSPLLQPHSPTPAQTQGAHFLMSFFRK
nr:hypothetical protein [Tanacetum cinerariifolium]